MNELAERVMVIVLVGVGIPVAIALAALSAMVPLIVARWVSRKDW